MNPALEIIPDVPAPAQNLAPSRIPAKPNPSPPLPIPVEHNVLPEPRPIPNVPEAPLDNPVPEQNNVQALRRGNQVECILINFVYKKIEN